LFEESKRILKTNGILLAATPFLMPLHQEPYDFNRYTPYAYREFCNNAGFKQVEIVPLGTQLAALDALELKTLYGMKKGLLFSIFRKWRRFETEILKSLWDGPTNKKTAEGFGLYARA